MNELLQPLYEEFGREHVGVVRRELTSKLNRPPNYVELVTELMRRQGQQTPPSVPAPGGDDHE